MIRYIINRLLSIVFTFFFISVLVFVLMHAIPGGPFDPVDMPLSDSAKAKILKQYGLDQPIYCLLYTSPSPRDRTRSRMPSSA